MKLVEQSVSAFTYLWCKFIWFWDLNEHYHFRLVGKKKKMMPVMEEEVLLLQLQAEMIGFGELLCNRG
jgi:hypothetical protein